SGGSGLAVFPTRQPSYPVVYRIRTTDMHSDLGFRALLTRTQLRWLNGRDPKGLTVDDLVDEPPVPKATPHQITDDERASIIAAARDEKNSDKAHRKLAHHLSRTDQAFVSESTVLRVLRSVALVCRFQGRAGKPKAAKPEVAVEAPNEIWAWDISYCRVGNTFWYLIAIIDMFSRKIVGHAVRPSATSDDVKDVFDKALANEGLLGTDAKIPVSLSDRGPQMRSKTIRRRIFPGQRPFLNNTLCRCLRAPEHRVWPEYVRKRWCSVEVDLPSRLEKLLDRDALVVGNLVGVQGLEPDLDHPIGRRLMDSILRGSAAGRTATPSLPDGSSRTSSTFFMRSPGVLRRIEYGSRFGRPG
ncbi:MAG: DDE-type integrase/transposase/recombinase, partial [Actinomycetota bacterium]|nr:DDE-type integrase/transposase/recombinase [Actinomycetota bacterium]